MTKKTLVTQIVMTFLMAATMSGVMGLIFAGPSMEWLMSWPKQFAVAWPIAFVLTMVAWPTAMAVTGLIFRSSDARQQAAEAS